MHLVRGDDDRRELRAREHASLRESARALVDALVLDHRGQQADAAEAERSHRSRWLQEADRFDRLARAVGTCP